MHTISDEFDVRPDRAALERLKIPHRFIIELENMFMKHYAPTIRLHLNRTYLR